MNYAFVVLRRVIPESTWAEIRTAYASGVGLREIARNIRISPGTILSRAKREGWTQQIQNAQALAKREDKSNTATPIEGVVATLNERKDKSRLNLSKYVVDASGRAANSRGDLSIASRVRSLSENPWRHLAAANSRECDPGQRAVIRCDKARRTRGSNPRGVGVVDTSFSPPKTVNE